MRMKKALPYFLWYRKFLRLSEFAAGKSRKRAKLVFLPYRKVRHNVVRCQQELVGQILAKLAAGPTFFTFYVDTTLFKVYNFYKAYTSTQWKVAHSKLAENII